MAFQCCGGGEKPSVPPDYLDASAEDLRALYTQSLKLNGGRLIVHGIFSQYDKVNNNRRVYPRHILQREVRRFKHNYIRTGMALGELDHPHYKSRYFRCLNLANVSHQVLEYRWVGDKLWGTAEILPTPSGLLLWQLYSQGVRVGVSSRGWSSLREDPATRYLIIEDDYELITFDFVTEPSTHDAFLVPIIKRYRHSIPDQTRAVRMSYLGCGSVSMPAISLLPDAAVVASRLLQIAAALCGLAPGAATPPAHPDLAKALGSHSSAGGNEHVQYMSPEAVIVLASHYCVTEVRAADAFVHLIRFSRHVAGRHPFACSFDRTASCSSCLLAARDMMLAQPNTCRFSPSVSSRDSAAGRI